MVGLPEERLEALVDTDHLLLVAVDIRLHPIEQPILICHLLVKVLCLVLDILDDAGYRVELVVLAIQPLLLHAQYGAFVLVPRGLVFAIFAAYEPLGLFVVVQAHIIERVAGQRHGHLGAQLVDAVLEPVDLLDALVNLLLRPKG